MSYDSGIDRYEAQRLAEDAARTAASEAERNIGYELERLRDEIRSLERRLEEAQAARRAAVDEVWEAIADVLERLKPVQA